MLIPDNLKYTRDHEWVKEVETSLYRIGITDFAQDALGDVVYVEVKELGISLTPGDAFGEAESTKSVSDLYAPIEGKLASSNSKLQEEPGLINTDPYGEGWICEIQSTEESTKNGLLNPEEYRELIMSFEEE